ncbi:EF-hand domain-containing protein [Pseudoalteromonas fenneropenaei]|uniref:EF-hand domain-containing protein n=1 Tax=Pseudoalteromonas fenneropenaei TaxID=1737459 RepID=A0ABV7CGD8_9GAMM
MKTVTKTLVAAAGLTLALTSQMSMAQSEFEKYDVDGNGAISLSESKANPVLMAQFKDLDVDNSGELSEAEFANFKG